MAHSLSKLSTKCKNCPNLDKCNQKEMELCALAELPTQASANITQSVMDNASMPLLREPIKNTLCPYAYIDELEEALNNYHFGNRLWASI